jgi:hypothetical protein
MYYAMKTYKSQRKNNCNLQAQKKRHTVCPQNYGVVFKIKNFVTINARSMSETQSKGETVKDYLCC